MMYIIKNGAFLSKEDGSTVSSLTGVIAGIRSISNENGESIQIDLASTGEDGQPKTDTISVRKFGDASLKILRCLFGVADILIGKELTFSLQTREGMGALITVSADGELLAPEVPVEPYARDKKAMTIRMLNVLRDIFCYRLDVVIYANKDGFYPKDEYGNFNAAKAAEYIRELRIAGRASEIVCKKISFDNKAAADGFMLAARTISGVSRCIVLRADDFAAETVYEAWTEELPAAQEEPAPAPATNRVASDEED